MCPVNKNNNLKLVPGSGEKVVSLPGHFSIDRKNDLVLVANDNSRWKQEYGIPEQIKFSGTWRLTPNHNLALDFKQRETIKEDSIVLQGEIFDANSNELTFKMRSKQGRTTHISFLTLKGKWQADRHNRIVFEVAKTGDPDKLVFKNTWNIDKKHQIVYRYERMKTKTQKQFVLDGYWDICDKNKLRYVVSGAPGSYIDFHAALQTPNLYPAKNKIKYRVGIGTRHAHSERVVCLDGEWKFSRRFGVFFEMDYKKKIRKISFQARLSSVTANSLTFGLSATGGAPLGMSITFKRPFVSQRNFEYLLRLKKERKSLVLEAGGTIRF